jgi:hypothetical protein
VVAQVAMLDVATSSLRYIRIQCRQARISKPRSGTDEEEEQTWSNRVRAKKNV